MHENYHYVLLILLCFSKTPTFLCLNSQLLQASITDSNMQINYLIWSLEQCVSFCIWKTELPMSDAFSSSANGLVDGKLLNTQVYLWGRTDIYESKRNKPLCRMHTCGFKRKQIKKWKYLKETHVFLSHVICSLYVHGGHRFQGITQAFPLDLEVTQKNFQVHHFKMIMYALCRKQAQRHVIPAERGLHVNSEVCSFHSSFPTHSADDHYCPWSPSRAKMFA